MASTSASSPSIKSSTRRRDSSVSNSRSSSSQAIGKSTAPISLARRLLFPALPLDQPLPPFLFDDYTTDAQRLLDNELYDFIALALRAFVHPWWAKLTRFDREFLPRITLILRHVFRTLAFRLQHVDLPGLLCSEIPYLITQHVVDYRAAVSAQGTAYAGGGAASIPALFHARQNHMAVAVDGTVNEEYIRCAVDHVLRVCLPAQDYTPETERFIVLEIVLMILTRSVIPKVTQPWFIHKIILDQLGKDKTPQIPTTERKTREWSIQSIALIFLTTVKSVYTILLTAYTSITETIQLVNQFTPQTPLSSCLSHSSTLSIHSSDDKFITTPPGSVPSTPRLYRSLTESIPSLDSQSNAKSPEIPPIRRDIPDYARPTLEFVSAMLGTEFRLASSALLGFLYVTTAAFQSFLSKLLPYMLHKHMDASLVTTAIQAAKKALFPDGWPGPPPPDPSPEEQVSMREELVRRLAERVPAAAGKVVLGSDVTRTMDEAIAPFDHHACNVHLVVYIIDLVLLTLFPELGIGGSEPKPPASSGHLRTS